MDSRKYQLQKQIIEALKANDDDLHALLKSQWAHRFGVESLDELNNIDVNQFSQKSSTIVNQKIDQSQESFFESDKSITKKDDENEEIEIKTHLAEKIKDVNNESYTIKSSEKVYKDNDENKVIKQFNNYKNQPKVKALIPLPPKPKYGFLKKWLLKTTS